MTTKKANPWSRKTNQTGKPSGRASSPPPSNTSKSGTVKLSGLRKPVASPVPTSGTQRKGALAKLSSGAGRNKSISQEPSTKVTSPDTSKPGTRSLRRPLGASRPSGASPSPPKSATTSTRRSSTTSSTPTADATSRRILETRQPFGGSSLHEDAKSANLKRARRMSSTFPPGKKVRVEWDRDPAYATGPGVFVGVVDNYDTSGYLTAISHDNVKLWIPCGAIRIKAAA